MDPTHVLYVLTNWDGVIDKCWMLAYKEDEIFMVVGTCDPVIQYDSDEILKEIELSI